jgi:hypothetical protein
MPGTDLWRVQALMDHILGLESWAQCSGVHLWRMQALMDHVLELEYLDLSLWAQCLRQTIKY